jgi:hypothetical protein
MKGYKGLDGGHAALKVMAMMLIELPTQQRGLAGPRSVVTLCFESNIHAMQCNAMQQTNDPSARPLASILTTLSVPHASRITSPFASAISYLTVPDSPSPHPTLLLTNTRLPQPRAFPHPLQYTSTRIWHCERRISLDNAGISQSQSRRARSTTHSSAVHLTSPRESPTLAGID